MSKKLASHHFASPHLASRLRLAVPQPSHATPAGSLPTSQLPRDPAGPAAWSAPGPLGASPPAPRVDRRGGYCPRGVFYHLLNP